MQYMACKRPPRLVLLRMLRAIPITARQRGAYVPRNFGRAGTDRDIAKGHSGA
jgi:hypothetical protein